MPDQVCITSSKCVSRDLRKEGGYKGWTLNEAKEKKEKKSPVAQLRNNLSLPEGEKRTDALLKEGRGG